MLLINQLLQQPALLAYFVGADNYAWLQFRNGERRLLAKPLVYFEERLPSFIRIHKTALINPVYISSLQTPPRSKMAGSVRLLDGTELPVSRRRWQKVVQLVQTNHNLAELYPDRDSQDQYAEKAAHPLRVQLIMSGDTLLLTRHCLSELGVPCAVQSTPFGAEFASSLLLNSPDEWPLLVLIDARTNRADHILALQNLKSHPQLRAIPVVWLVASGDDQMQAYLLDANSVVVVPDEPTAFVKTIKDLLQYWLMVVQLAI